MPDLKIVYCATCGSTLHTNFRVCPSCGGNSFTDSEFPTSTTQNSSVKTLNTNKTQPTNGTDFAASTNVFLMWLNIGKAYKALFQNLPVFLRLSWILSLITYGAQTLFQKIAQTNLSFEFSSLFILLVYPITASIFAVAWHRFILLNESHNGNWGYFAIGRREFLFVLTSILLTVLIYLVAFIPSFLARHIEVGTGISFIISFGILIGLGILCSPLALIYPRIASDKTYSFSKCMEIGRHNKLRIYFGSIIALIPVTIIGALIIGFVKALFSVGSLSFIATIPIDILSILLQFSAIAVGAAFLSYCYQALNQD